MSSDTNNETAPIKPAMPHIKDQFDSLQTAADDLATSRTIDTAERVEVVEIARQMVESLTAAGFHQAAARAQGVLTTLQHPGLPQPERLQQQVSALREALAPAVDE